MLGMGGMQVQSHEESEGDINKSEPEACQSEH
jgi:hypothetical protein